MYYEKLFSPLTIRGLTLPNRVVMSAMGSLMVKKDKKVTQELIDYLTERAKGGVGLVYAPCCSVHEPSASECQLSICNNEIAKTHEPLTASIHAVGGKCGLQLLQGSINVFGAKMLIPSDMEMEGTVLPGMTKEEIAEVVAAYGVAAARAVAAGYDILEFHCGHGYLPHLFLNPTMNQRTDEYGGSFENRCRFPLECLKSIRANMPAEMPLAMRIVSRDDYFEKNTTIEEMIAFSKLAKEVGVDLLNISRGNGMDASMRFNVPPVDIERGFNREDAARIRKETGMLASVCGRINTPELAEQLLEEDQADLVVMARAQIADPEFCNKAKAGKADEIIYCIGCNQGCHDPHFVPENFYDETVHVTCLRNPAAGREREYRLEKTANPKRVLVIGGGMGGMEAAYRLQAMGHHVTLFEASDHLGGQFLLAGASPRKGEFAKAAQDCARRLERNQVDVRLNAVVDKALLEKEQPNAVVIAIGAEPIHIRLEGMEQKPVYSSHDVLANKCRPEGHVVIIGGGMVGLETAELLSSWGNRVTVVEMQDTLAADMGLARRMCTLEAMEKEGIECLTGTKCCGVDAAGIIAEQDGVRVTIPCDSIVMAVGSRARSTQELEDACKALNIPSYVIGDAVKARRALNATAEGAAVAYKIEREL